MNAMVDSEMVLNEISSFLRRSEYDVRILLNDAATAIRQLQQRVETERRKNAHLEAESEAEQDDGR